MSNLGAGGGPPCYFSCWEPLVLKIANSELHIFQRRLGALFFRGGCLTKHSMWWISSIHQTKFEWNMSSTWKIFVNNRTKKLWNLNDEKKNVCKCTTLDWEWGSAESEDLLREIFSLPRIGDTGGVERFGFLLLFHNYCQHNHHACDYFKKGHMRLWESSDHIYLKPTENRNSKVSLSIFFVVLWAVPLAKAFNPLVSCCFVSETLILESD